MAENNKAEFDWNARQFGALWKKESAAGNTNLSGSIKWKGEEIRVLICKNKPNENPNYPAYRVICMNDEIPEGAIEVRPQKNGDAPKPAPAKAPAKAAPAKTPYKKQAPAPAPADDDDGL